MTDSTRSLSRNESESFKNDLFDLLVLESHATKGQWMLYDSNSWRRIGLKGDYSTLIEPTNHPIDKHADLTGPNLSRDLHLMLAARNFLLVHRERLESMLSAPSETVPRVICDMSEVDLSKLDLIPGQIVRVNDQDAKDAARYRWIKSERAFSDAGMFIARQDSVGIVRWNNEAADELIDGAIEIYRQKSENK